MADYADALIAFWDGKSRGTKNMIELATKQGLKVRIYERVVLCCRFNATQRMGI